MSELDNTKEKRMETSSFEVCAVDHTGQPLKLTPDNSPHSKHRSNESNSPMQTPQVENKSNSKFNAARPSLTYTSKSNNSSVCIHGAAEQERLEKRYDSKINQEVQNNLTT